MTDSPIVSAADQHRMQAKAALHRAPNLADRAAISTQATAHALLAIEARLGELVEEQRIRTALGIVGIASDSSAAGIECAYVLARSVADIGVRGIADLADEIARAHRTGDTVADATDDPGESNA
ncbi:MULTISPECIES: hypothetical protein [Nocardia]|uniref:Uncharacterized protein n=1 Tax=Nocardia nova TaxID=37330 RepID=A0A2T2Z888_9NOCA|nr:MULTISPECIES: hypothetical protein [Nocardia]PSR63961.1 hypothetical protein C8259_08910 [Nocardia nova]